MATNFGSKIGTTGFVRQIATIAIAYGGGLSSQPTECRYCRWLRFWDYINCKWRLTVDNDMGISYKRWLVFSQPKRLLVALSGFVVAAVGTAPGG